MSAILIALLSGAVGGAVISALFDYFKMMHQFKINYVRKQIDHFYGPLYFILSHSSKSFENANSILDAHRDYFSANEWSQEESTQKKLQADSSTTIEISNKYVESANTNNQKIFEIIMNNYSFIDLDDISVVDEFIKNYTRLNIEHAGDKKLPYMIYKMVGNISFLPNDLKDKIMEKFTVKKRELENQSLFGEFKKSLCCKLKKK